MSRYVSNNTTKVDWVIIALYASLVLIGWLMIYASVYDGSESFSYFSFQNPFSKQSIFLIIAIAVFVGTQLIPWEFWRNFSFPIFFLTTLLLILVLLFGSTIKGSTSWFQIAGFSFQPSEFAKLGTCLALSNYLSSFKVNLKNIRHLMLASGIIFLPLLLILLQPDAGSAISFIAFSVVLYRNGLSPLIFILAASLILLFALSLVSFYWFVILGLSSIGLGIFLFQFKKQSYSIVALILITALGVFLGLYWQTAVLHALCMIVLSFFLWKKRRAKLAAIIWPIMILSMGFSYFSSFAFNNLLKPHQQDRVNVWLRPELCDPKGSLYNIIYSKMAIGSGGIKGKGFLQGDMTQLNYVPEQTTDFIFSTIGEEQGFIGCLGVILLFTMLLIRILRNAEYMKSAFARNYAYGVAGIIFIHFFINIGMTMNLVPVIGIPLPFISAGGSSLLGFTFMLGIMVKMTHQK